MISVLKTTEYVWKTDVFITRNWNVCVIKIQLGTVKRRQSSLRWGTVARRLWQPRGWGHLKWHLKLERRHIRRSWTYISCPGKWLCVSLLHFCPWFSVPHNDLCWVCAESPTSRPGALKSYLLCWLSVQHSLRMFVHMYGRVLPLSKDFLLCACVHV